LSLQLNQVGQNLAHQLLKGSALTVIQSFHEFDSAGFVVVTLMCYSADLPNVISHIT